MYVNVYMYVCVFVCVLVFVYVYINVCVYIFALSTCIMAVCALVYVWIYQPTALSSEFENIRSDMQGARVHVRNFFNILGYASLPR